MSNTTRNSFINTLRNFLRQLYNNNSTSESQPSTNNTEEGVNTNSEGNNPPPTVEDGLPSIVFFMSLLEPGEDFNPIRNASILDYILRIRLGTINNEYSDTTENQTNQQNNSETRRTNSFRNPDNLLYSYFSNETMSDEGNAFRERVEEIMRSQIHRREGLRMPRFRHFRVRSEEERESHNHNFPYLLVFDMVSNGSTISLEFHSDEATIIENMSWLVEFGFVQPPFFSNICQPASLKKLKLHRISKKENIKDCSICLNQFKYRELARTLPCEHVFHSKCVDKWLLHRSNTCPICRKVVEDKQSA